MTAWFIYWDAVLPSLLFMLVAALLAFMVGYVFEFFRAVVGRRTAAIAGTLAMFVAVGAYVALVGSGWLTSS